MSRVLVLLCYNILLPMFFIVAFPAWLVKMWKRGGYGTGLRQRFACYKRPSSEEPKDTMYVHAVSVGEVLIALKLIDQWLKVDPEVRVVLAATTSTGHAVAREKSPGSVRVVYSPLDFGWIVRSVIRRFEPLQIILIEAEAWPNLLNIARKNSIPIAMVNARLSNRSEARFKKLRFLVEPLFAMIDLVCVQNDEDASRFRSLGIASDRIQVTGSIKFDPSGGAKPERRETFQQMLNDFDMPGAGRRRIILVASSHPGEEKLLAQAWKKTANGSLLVVVPRHAERRQEVRSDLESCGLEVVLRSNYHSPRDPETACLVVDSTGELRDWTAHADIVIIGKSWLGVGGQNPAEAIAAGVPVVTGPDMSNFEPLVTMLVRAGGIKVLTTTEDLGPALDELLTHKESAEKMCESARKTLANHENAVGRTIEVLNLNASVRKRNV